MIKISIIIPVFNRQDLIESAVESVICQTLKEIEIICIDDGSTDNTMAVLKRLSERDARISVLHKENEGPGAARNQGVFQAKGEYVFFLDSDDAIAGSKVLELLYAKAAETGSAICGGKLLIQDNNDIYTAEDTVLSREGYVDFSDFQHDFYFFRFIYNREFLISHNIIFPNLRMYEDPVFFVNSMDRAGGFYYVDLNVYLYRKSSNNSCSNNLSGTGYSDEKYFDWLTGLTHILKLSSKNKWDLLHLEVYNRLVFSICPRIKQRIPEVDEKIIRKLISANENLDIALLSPHVKIDDNYLLPPIKQLISLSKKYIDLHNKRILKLYRIIIRPFRKKR